MKTGYLIFIVCIVLLALASGASATQVTVTPKQIDSGQTINVHVHGMPNGQKFSVTVRGSFIVNSGDAFTFETENITLPIGIGDGKFTVKNMNTADNDIVLEEFNLLPGEEDTNPHNIMTFAGPTVGEVFTGSSNFDELDRGIATVTWGGTALGNVKTTFTMNSRKTDGPRNFDIPITVTADHPGVVEVVFRQNGQPVFRGQVLLSNPSVTGGISVTSKPSGANVYLDGVFQGITPTGDITGIPTGLHQIKVTKSGYFPVTRNVNVPDGSTASVYIKLTRR